ncbi:uncharacterized protein LOC128756510 isoform X3 [Synchiropus splendidus]|uniref:uncharacterized protein LOC128756510 isoform X3 n=1 Tax=Synchiropus splendidus TaxID=270530 RepID=UPI00237E0013|nr:uncharacterized protein LOC128756510 isoform X3 [Synchiropus splendidus]
MMRGRTNTSIEVIQSLLKKVSQSPFHDQYSNGELLADCPAGDVESSNQTLFSENLKMEASHCHTSGVQDGVSGGLSRSNPIYAYYLESGYNNQGREDVSVSSEKATSDSIFSSHEFQQSPTDPQAASRTLENGSSEHPKDPFWTPTPVPRLPKKPALNNSLTKETHHDVTLGTPDHENLSKSLTSDSINRDVGDIFHAPKDEGKAPQSDSSNSYVNPFQSSSNMSDDLFQIPEPRVKTLSMDVQEVFSPSSSHSVDPFPSPITRNLLSDFSSLDDSADAKEPELIQRPLSMFLQSPPSKTVEKSSAFDTPSTDVPNGILLTTPDGRTYDSPQESPVLRPRNLSASPSSSPNEMEHVPTFKRPPRPLPRTRLRKPDKPPQPKDMEADAVAPKASPKLAIRPLPKPPIRLKQKSPQMKPVDPANFVVFEDILLIGQEHCVEDWPDDSPQLQPDFKPGGTLRLRRESLLMKTESDGASGEDQNGQWSHGKKKDKFRVSTFSRRGSKQDKFSEDMKQHKSQTLPLPRKSSKEYFPDYSAEKQEDDHLGYADYKKTPLKTKVNQLLRRASTVSSAFDAKLINKKKGSMADDSTGDEESGGRHDETDDHGSKKKKRMNIKFIPQRGFTISMEKDKKPMGAEGYTPRKDSGMDDDLMKPPYVDPGSHGSVDDLEAEDCKPKRSPMKKLLHRGHRSSKEDMLDDCPKKGSFSAEELDEEEQNGMDNLGDYYYDDDEDEEEDSIKGCRSPREAYDYEVDELGITKQKKPSKLKVFRKNKSKSKRPKEQYDLPPGAPPGLSEAAKAEWMAAQMDERAMAGLEDEDADGDTDSLMEWWYKVEQWDEVPSDDENKMLQEDESKSFTILADKVDRGLRVFNKVFTERAELLWQYIISLHAIADDISTFHKKAKIANITGGTTTAVGGVTAIAGLALAPVTMGVSLVVTAVGLGVATAGGIASASATISDNVNNMHDRKKVESLLLEYEENLQDVAKILRFVNHGMYKLRGHPFLRSGTQHYSQDWDVRRAVQMISMADSPVMRATEITDEALSTLQGLFQGMDKYFIKDSRELKKGCKKEIVAQIKELASVLNDAIVELNGLREELQDAFGAM